MDPIWQLDRQAEGRGASRWVNWDAENLSQSAFTPAAPGLEQPWDRLGGMEAGYVIMS